MRRTLKRTLIFSAIIGVCLSAYGLLQLTFEQNPLKITMSETSKLSKSLINDLSSKDQQNYIQPYLKAQYAFKHHDFPTAITQFKKARSLITGEIPNRINWAVVYSALKGGEFALAVEEVEENDLEDYNQWTILILIADALRQQDYERALSLSQEGTLDLTQSIGPIFAINAAAGLENWELAHFLLDESFLVKRELSFKDIVRARLWIQQDEHDKAFALLSPETLLENEADEAMETHPIYSMPEDRFRLYVLLLARQGETELALDTLKARMVYATTNRYYPFLLDKIEAGEAASYLEEITADPLNNLAETIAAFVDELGTPMQETGLSLLRLAEGIVPDHPIVTYELIDFYIDQTDFYEAALKMVKPLIGTPELGVGPKLKQADLLALLERDEEAIKVLFAAAEQSQGIEAFGKIGLIYRRQHEYAKAAEIYQQAIDQMEANRDAYFNNHNETLGDPTNRFALGFLYHYLGVSYERADDWPKAEAAFLTSLEWRPDYSDTLNYLGYSWIDMGMNLDQGTEMLLKAVELSQTGYIIDSLGWAYYRLERYEEAVTELERAILLMPGDPIVNDHLGDAYWQVGRHREANYQWQRALEFDPESENEAIIRDKLENGLTQE